MAIDLAAPGTPAARIDAPPTTRARPRHANLVVVAGVPGAGKSTAIRAVTAALVEVRAVDSEEQRAWLARHLPPGTPYALYRPLTHLAHQFLLFALLLAGPGRLARTGRGQLLVHDPGTRRRWRALVSRLAAARRWDTALVVIDVGRAEALAGQVERRRVVRARSFERHWSRWARLRDQPDPEGALVGGDPWGRAYVVDRRGAAPLLWALFAAKEPGRSGRRPPRRRRSQDAATKK